MKRRTAIKLSLISLASSYAMAYDKSKIVNTIKMKKKDPEKPEKGELKHTPDITVGEVDAKGYISVEVNVGQEGIIHPSTEDHWIYKIELYANGEKVAQVDLEPSISRGYLATKVKKNGLNELRAISCCNLHGDWENVLKV
ncbi:desulfoferrodoxin family protein [Sulfurovum sp. ST-21]|uniref:Twin-arginine translocation pathway signal protein n=1 Tax=Sulfurovum indicum TaxID=2779528 RepID=A0A7M1S1B0_9BACT|nr:desulfoferrodoxin family protein [Sulfurovum indicum]QOR61253.1 twin-arginine translocation pathway signal protein [Sulfurovum indicum]